jgi:Flp pilus assembly protein TadG
MIARRKNLARDDSGAVLIELALAAPVLAMMVIGISDISIAYGKKLELEQAAQRAIEKVMQTTGKATAAETIKTEAVCQYNGVDSDGVCSTVGIDASDVTVSYNLKCNGAVTAYNTDCPDGEAALRYIQATVADQYTPMFPVHFGTQSDGTYHLSATAGVRVSDT